MSAPLLTFDSSFFIRYTIINSKSPFVNAGYGYPVNLRIHSSAPVDMLVGKQVILAVFVIALTLRAETELQIIPVLLRPAADCAFMLGNSLRLAHLLAVNLFPAYLVRGIFLIIPGTEEKYQEIHQRGKDCHPSRPIDYNERK